MTVQPEGIPLIPVVQLFIVDALVNVPEEETPDNQFFVQLVAEISVAKQVILLRFVQPENIDW